MSEAVYGVLGALGGSLVAAAAAYWGPLRLQRQTAAHDRMRLRAEQQAAAQAEAAAAQAAAEEREYREQQARLDEQRLRRSLWEERMRIEEAKAISRRETAIKRIVLVRTTAREWSQILDRILQDLEHGQDVTVEHFDRHVSPLRSATQAALDGAMQDGFGVVAQSRSSSTRYRNMSDEMNLRRGEAVRVEVGVTSVALSQATMQIRAALLAQERTAEQLSELRLCLEEANDARHAMTVMFMELIEVIVS
ncbi:hypothetical protein ACFU99_00710 [Streptomyces sp. NPDC057654]|uniref:hypothetical protein n=1 Tax=Streptomyces sp. NPDC057654 TaxID=3346196 RepID=UPI003680B409